jgi:hypothetical protein
MRSHLGTHAVEICARGLLFGIKAERSFQRLCGARQIACRCQQRAEVGLYVGIFGIPSRGLAEMRQRSSVLPLPEFNCAERRFGFRKIVACVLVFRIEAQRCSEFGNRFREVSLHEKRSTETVVRSRIRRISPQGPMISPDCAR